MYCCGTTAGVWCATTVAEFCFCLLKQQNTHKAMQRPKPITNPITSPAIAPPEAWQHWLALSAKQYPPHQQSVSVSKDPQEPVYVVQPQEQQVSLVQLEPEAEVGAAVGDMQISQPELTVE